MNPRVTVAGAGPAGSSAAIAALLHGASVTLFEKSQLPVHRVCGEFLSPEIVPLLQRLGVWERIGKCSPVRYPEVRLHFRSEHPGACFVKSFPFPEPPYGISRRRLDAILLERALELGASLVHERVETADIQAHGRHAAAGKSAGRMFGFKAHFRGAPPHSAGLSLFFFDGGYAGVNEVEDGITNVCGVASEALLRRNGFDAGSLIAGVAALRDRIAPLEQSFDWLYTGPLAYHRPIPSAIGSYLAGDALSFTSPFTGSGVLSAVLTGWLAGKHAAQGAPASAYLAACRRSIRSSWWAASAFRAVLRTPWTIPAIRLVPGRLLVSLTRPTVRP